MTNQEILSNIDYYDGQIKSYWQGTRPKRQLELKMKDVEKAAEHSRYLIKSLREMIAKNEKEQRIHRHYGFLQCIILVVLECSIKNLMFENKYGAKRFHAAVAKYGDGWEKNIESVQSKDWDGRD